MKQKSKFNFEWPKYEELRRQGAILRKRRKARRKLRKLEQKALKAAEFYDDLSF